MEEIQAKAILICGFAGCGKSTFVACSKNYLEAKKKKVYIVNLDPAVKHLDYKPDLDIRDTVSYENLMESMSLGPNGAIMVALNLFVAKIDEIYKILEKQRWNNDYIFIDIPGQIEIFTWSASGDIISECLTKIFEKRSIYYLIDGSKMSDVEGKTFNILHACSVYYRAKTIPMTIIYTKCDLLETTTRLMNVENDDELINSDENEDFSFIFMNTIKETFSDSFKLFPFFCTSSNSNNGLKEIYKQ